MVCPSPTWTKYRLILDFADARIGCDEFVLKGRYILFIFFFLISAQSYKDIKLVELVDDSRVKLGKEGWTTAAIWQVPKTAFLCGGGQSCHICGKETWQLASRRMDDPARRCQERLTSERPTKRQIPSIVLLLFSTTYNKALTLAASLGTNILLRISTSFRYNVAWTQDLGMWRVGWWTTEVRGGVLERSPGRSNLLKTMAGPTVSSAEITVSNFLNLKPQRIRNSQLN
ncbi:hypothetical protein LAZ67_17002535 [Cordylochernes scorpioides]|uniref:Uncharacterized protein n=1 Tax=Cordylochernes scorpioides TaxID=51811 RepID=A0ABY6LEC7_9ARAC|nr:hypothetical protein LAZ67_17002535 [Cordylochernes scorpioides]